MQNIIFDLGGVLINLDIHKTRHAFINLGITDIDQYFGIGYAAAFFKDYEIGAINDEEFLEAARKLCKPGTTAQAVVHAWNSILLDFPQERVQLLQRLGEKYRIFLFSNTNSLHMQSFQKTFWEVHGFELDSLFEKAWYSQIIHRRKPDVKAFEFVIKDKNLDPAETLFIDDALVNVEGARAAGLQAVHLAQGQTVLDLDLD